MERKTAIWIGVAVFSTIGSYIPALWGGSLFSFTSIILGGAGGILGIYLGYKISQY
jgi:hypothetical protein